VDAAIMTERPESYPRIVDRGRRTSAVTSGVPDPAQLQLGERSVLTELVVAATRAACWLPLIGAGSQS
jgi:hypothetical protein